MGDPDLLLIDEIKNVRSTYAEEGIRQLAASIEKRGLLQPVILSEMGTRYGIQAGHRRGSGEAGWITPFLSKVGAYAEIRNAARLAA